MGQQTLLKADTVTLTAAADKEGRIRINCASWSDPVVLLPGLILELKWVQGQVVLIRRPGKK
jgi:hypothetical protein